MRISQGSEHLLVKASIALCKGPGALNLGAAGCSSMLRTQVGLESLRGRLENHLAGDSA